jgi:membrane protein
MWIWRLLVKIWSLVKETVSEAGEDKVPRLAASLAFYTLLSLSPLVIVAISVAGLVFGQEAARGQIAGELRSVFGPEASDGIQAIMAHASRPSTGIISAAIGAVVLLFGASGVFGELQDSLNTLWEVAPKPDRGLWGMVRDRFMSFSMVLGVAFLLLVSLVVSAGLHALGAWLSSSFAAIEWIGEVINFVVSLGITSLLFALLYKVVPDVKIAWRDVWVGGLVTAFLFALGKFGIGLYMGKAGVASPFGAAGSLVVIVVWVYYSAHILFFGAEFTQVYARAMGSRLEPSRGAVALTEEARAQQGIPHKETLDKAAGGQPAGSNPVPVAAKPGTITGNPGTERPSHT